MSNTEAYAKESQGPVLLIGCITPFVIATVFVFARFYCRGILLRSWGADDGWIVFSWLLGLGLVLVNCLVVALDGAHHQSTIPITKAKPLLKLRFAGRLIYQVVVGTIKVSVCYFNLRVFSDKKARIINYSIMGFVWLYTLAFFLASILVCIPITEFWSIKPGHCTGAHPLLIITEASGTLNIFADILLLIFVVPRILALHMPRKQKIALLISVSMSVLVIVAALLRTLITVSIAHSHDFSWDVAYAEVWSVVEVSAGLFCTSAPALKPLLRMILPSFLVSRNQGSSGIGTYARGRDATLNSRRRQDHLELVESASELNEVGLHRQSKSGHTIWRGDSESLPMVTSEMQREVNGSDDVEGGIYDPINREYPPQYGQIRKTVSITVANGRGRNLAMDDVDRNVGDAKNFEHI